MNLKTIKVYQNGKLIDEIKTADKEDFDAIQNVHDLFYKTNGLFRDHLITTLVLMDFDKEGQPEVLDSKIVKPEWNEEKTELVRQGYLLAMTRLRQECLFPLDSDAHKIHELHCILEEAERSTETGAPIILNPNIYI